MAKPVRIAPSMMAADVGRLAEEALRVEAAGADWLHVDIMDAHFVPNLTFGPATVAAIKKVASVPVEVHLMLASPDKFLEAFARAGVSGMTIHLEADIKVEATLAKIRALGCRAGLALKPTTPLEKVMPYLEQVDLLLCMTVSPGFGGQRFITEVLDKVKLADDLRRQHGWTFDLEVDGGINVQTAAASREAGADVIAAGTSVFSAVDAAAEITALRGIPNDLRE